MDSQRHPSKEEVRAWLARRGSAHRPPPAPDEIRRELGWHLRPAPVHSAGNGRVPASSRPLCTAPPILVLPAIMAELAALTAVAWYFMAIQQTPKQYR